MAKHMHWFLKGDNYCDLPSIFLFCFTDHIRVFPVSHFFILSKKFKNGLHYSFLFYNPAAFFSFSNSSSIGSFGLLLLVEEDDDDDVDSDGP